MPLIGEWGYPIIDEAGYTRLSTDAGVYQDAMEMLQVRLAQDYLNIWAALPPGMSTHEMYLFLGEALADLQMTYGTDAASLAAEYLAMSRGGADLPVVLEKAANKAQVQSAVGWAMSKPETQKLLWGAMQRMTSNAYRETIRQSAFAAGNGFARVPEPGACAFCLMLASRGAVYYSKSEALKAGQARYSKSSRMDKSYHDNCKCSAIEVSSTSGLSESNIYLHDLWKRTFWHEGWTDDDGKHNIFYGPITFESAFPVWQEVAAKEKLPWLSNKPIPGKRR